LLGQLRTGWKLETKKSELLIFEFSPSSFFRI